MNWFRERTPLKRLLLIKAGGSALIALAIGALPMLVECPADGQLFAFGFAAWFSYIAYREFHLARRCSPDSFFEDDLENGFVKDSIHCTPRDHDV